MMRAESQLGVYNIGDVLVSHHRMMPHTCNATVLPLPTQLATQEAPNQAIVSSVHTQYSIATDKCYEY